MNRCWFYRVVFLLCCYYYVSLYTGIVQNKHFNSYFSSIQAAVYLFMALMGAAWLYLWHLDTFLYSVLMFALGGYMLFRALRGTGPGITGPPLTRRTWRNNRTFLAWVFGLTAENRHEWEGKTLRQFMFPPKDSEQQVKTPQDEIFELTAIAQQYHIYVEKGSDKPQLLELLSQYKVPLPLEYLEEDKLRELLDDYEIFVPANSTSQQMINTLHEHGFQGFRNPLESMDKTDLLALATKNGIPGAYQDYAKHQLITLLHKYEIYSPLPNTLEQMSVPQLRQLAKNRGIFGADQFQEETELEVDLTKEELKLLAAELDEKTTGNTEKNEKGKQTRGASRHDHNPTVGKQAQDAKVKQKAQAKLVSKIRAENKTRQKAETLKATSTRNHPDATNRRKKMIETVKLCRKETVEALQGYFDVMSKHEIDHDKKLLKKQIELSPYDLTRWLFPGKSEAPWWVDETRDPSAPNECEATRSMQVNAKDPEMVKIILITQLRDAGVYSPTPQMQAATLSVRRLKATGLPSGLDDWSYSLDPYMKLKVKDAPMHDEPTTEEHRTDTLTDLAEGKDAIWDDVFTFSITKQTKSLEIWLCEEDDDAENLRNVVWSFITSRLQSFIALFKKEEPHISLMKSYEGLVKDLEGKGQGANKEIEDEGAYMYENRIAEKEVIGKLDIDLHNNEYFVGDGMWTPFTIELQNEDSSMAQRIEQTRIHLEVKYVPSVEAATETVVQAPNPSEEATAAMDIEKLEKLAHSAAIYVAPGSTKEQLNELLKHHEVPVELSQMTDEELQAIVDEYEIFIPANTTREQLLQTMQDLGVQGPRAPLERIPKADLLAMAEKLAEEKPDIKVPEDCSKLYLLKELRRNDVESFASMRTPLEHMSRVQLIELARNESDNEKRDEKDREKLKQASSHDLCKDPSKAKAQLITLLQSLKIEPPAPGKLQVQLMSAEKLPTFQEERDFERLPTHHKEPSIYVVLSVKNADGSVEQNKPQSQEAPTLNPRFNERIFEFDLKKANKGAKELSVKVYDASRPEDKRLIGITTIDLSKETSDGTWVDVKRSLDPDFTHVSPGWGQSTGDASPAFSQLQKTLEFAKINLKINHRPPLVGADEKGEEEKKEKEATEAREKEAKEKEATEEEERTSLKKALGADEKIVFVTDSTKQQLMELVQNHQVPIEFRFMADAQVKQLAQQHGIFVPSGSTREQILELLKKCDINEPQPLPKDQVAGSPQVALDSAALEKLPREQLIEVALHAQSLAKALEGFHLADPLADPLRKALAAAAP